MLDLAGQTLGKYRLHERIGKGGMSIVYRAFQPGLERQVAVKALLPHLSDSDDFVRRFRREAQAVADLRHPNIVQVFDFDYDAPSDTYYMVMEYIEGETLKARLARLNRAGERLAPIEVVDFFEGLLAGVGYAHSRGMFHRDLKPANIMFDKGGRTVLTDFGIAHIVGGERFTLTGVVMGTPVYMSPEQGGGESGDTRSDLYSLGVVLYESLTGQVPYDADTPYAVMHKHLNQPVPSLSRTLPTAAALEPVVESALAKSPVERYQTAEAMWQGLSQARERLGNAAAAPGVPLVPTRAEDVTIHPSVTPVPASGRATAPARGGAALRRLKPVYGWTVAIAALVLALGGLLYYRGQAPARLQAEVAQGQAQLAAQDFPAALSTFDSIIERDPNETEARLGRAEALLGLGRPDEALLEVQAAAEHTPNDPAALVARGRYRLLYTSGPDLAASLYDFDTALAIQPDYAPAYLARGWARLNFGHGPGALPDLREAVRLAPDNPEAHRTLAEALHLTGDNSAALSEIETAIQLKNDDPEYFVESAVIREAVGAPVDAAHDLAAAITLAPEPGYYTLRAYVLLEAADLEQALADANESLRLAPDDPDALYTRGLIYSQQGDAARALVDLDAVLMHEPFEIQSPFLTLERMHEINLDRALALQSLPGREADALHAFDNAVEAEPEWFAGYYFRGVFLAGQRQTSAARADLELAAQLAPDADWQSRAQTELNALGE